jgi:hypothetical protein
MFAKKARGNRKLSGFFYLLQIKLISHYTVETLQKYSLTSDFLRENIVSQYWAQKITHLYSMLGIF